MKKWYLLIAGALLIAVTAQADCGACEGAEKAKDKAACEMKKGADKAECSMDKAECAKDKASCKMEAGMKKAECAKGEACKMDKECKDKTACEAKSGKKWYNPVSWFK